MFHSLCLITDSVNQGLQYTRDWIARQKIHATDIVDLTDQKVGIAEIRAVITFLSRTPFASPQKAVLVNADLLTPEAQQAFLKTLEEPPPKNTLFLITRNADQLLPTIVSRCQLIPLKNEAKTTPEENQQQFWTGVLTQSLSQRLGQTTPLTKDRDTLKNWLIDQIYYFRGELIKSVASRDSWIRPQMCTAILRQLHTTKNYVENNINLKLALDQLFLNLPVL